MQSFFAEPLLVISVPYYRQPSLGTLGFLEAELAVSFLAGRGQEQMTVALAQATVAWFSLYSFSQTRYSPCKGHRQSGRHMIRNIINHLKNAASSTSIQGLCLCVLYRLQNGNMHKKLFLCLTCLDFFVFLRSSGQSSIMINIELTWHLSVI